ncbi:adenylate/guanylate cyclase domain-containing protein [Afipia birgiae]|jgi:adenylate cyclase|uniref:adenylate/guanylate cyclase domain-containing protein n=1 Tax=Afipia birgiae TaxID=151414 RepID=UPI00031AAB10|nr:adenylate/guanylate cyclase domain-containing protein [Afipia birgiae]MBX9819747.1 adenylate/guanylate cyclase domain-containing protein [Afipia birgiae]
MQAVNLQSVADWLINGAQSARRVDEFMIETCERMVDCGIPLSRVGVFVTTLHPNMVGRNFIWRRGSGVTMGSMAYGSEESDDYLSSPLATVFEQGLEVRRRLLDEKVGNSPFFAEMRAGGATDYIALPLHMSDGETHASSWMTKHAEGFSDAQIDGMRSLMPVLTRMIEIWLLRRTAAGLLDNYVGARAGARILAGQIRRGHTESMQAAIWLSDLRGFTPLSDRLSSEAVVDVLNTYFDCQVPAILDHGGEVLKFMGDGLLAVFPINDKEGDTETVCRRALEAARACRASVAAMSYAYERETLNDFRFGLALHVGKVLYGNIGGGDRLDFTCIGPAVNLAARIEKIAGRLNRTVLASTEFASHVDAGWTDLGLFSVAGFSAAERVYGLADEMPALSGSQQPESSPN